MTLDKSVKEKGEQTKTSKQSRKNEPRSGRPRTDQTGQSEERILTAATEIFLERGFGRTTLDAVSEAARVSKTTLYGRFPNKEVLFAAVVDHSMQQLFQSPTAFVPSGGTLRERLIQSGIKLAEMTLTPAGIALMRVTSAEAETFPNVAQQGFQIGFGVCVQCIAECLAENDSEEAVAAATPTAKRFVEMALHPLYMHAFFGADLALLRQRAVCEVAEVAEFLLTAKIPED